MTLGWRGKGRGDHRLMPPPDNMMGDGLVTHCAVLASAFFPRSIVFAVILM